MYLNYIDIGVLVFVLLFTLRGAYRGAILELTGLISVVVGIILARLYAQDLSVYLSQYIPAHWALPAAFVLILIAVIILFALLATMLKGLMKALFVGFIDHIFGALAGAAKALLICAALAYIAAVFFPNIELVRTSSTIPYLLSAAHWIIGQIPTGAMESLIHGASI